MHDESAGEAPRAVVRWVVAVAAGIVVVVAAALVGIGTSWPLALLAPTLGGVAAGYLVRGGRWAGAVAGVVACGAVAVGALTAYVGWLASLAPAAGGAGLGLALVFLAILAGGVLGTVFGGVGGMLGAALRGELARGDRRGEVAHDDRRRTGGEKLDDGRPVREANRERNEPEPWPGDDAAVRSRTSTSDEPGVERAGRGTSATSVLLGGGIAIAVAFLPLSPVLGGAVTGYLERVPPRRGAALGAAAGVVATVLALAALVLLSLPAFFLLTEALVQLLPQLTALFAGYFVGFGAVGGALGGAIAQGGSDADW